MNKGIEAYIRNRWAGVRKLSGCYALLIPFTSPSGDCVKYQLLDAGYEVDCLDLETEKGHMVCVSIPIEF